MLLNNCLRHIVRSCMNHMVKVKCQWVGASEMHLDIYRGHTKHVILYFASCLAWQVNIEAKGHHMRFAVGLSMQMLIVALAQCTSYHSQRAWQWLLLHKRILSGQGLRGSCHLDRMMSASKNCWASLWVTQRARTSRPIQRVQQAASLQAGPALF